MRSHHLSRRHFLIGLGRAGVGVAAAATQLQAQNDQTRAARGRPTPSTSANPASSGTTKAGLLESDFTYVGSFKMPLDVPESDAQWGMGLTHRWVNGELRFFSKAHHDTVYEVAAPTLTSNAGNGQTARLVKTWGNVTGDYSYGTTFGLYWDEPDQRLYWSNGNTYNTTSPFDPSIGYSTLNAATGAVGRGGVWGLSGRSCKMALGGVLPVPDWFAAANCPGMRLAAGFGGYFSIVATGPASMGPALTAFNPAEMTSARNRGAVANRVLVGYPFNGAAYTTPDRCHRNPDYNTEFDGWKVRNGVGYWSWSDYIWQGAVWIDTPTKSGVMFFPTLGQGRTWYESSTLHAERASHWWFEYSPADLAAVAAGTKQQWQIQPSQSWQMQYPGISYPMGTWQDEPGQHVVGSTFDPATQTLFIAVRFALGVRSGSPIIVYAYRVNA